MKMPDEIFETFNLEYKGHVLEMVAFIKEHKDFFEFMLRKKERDEFARISNNVLGFDPSACKKALGDLSALMYQEIAKAEGISDPLRAEIKLLTREIEEGEKEIKYAKKEIDELKGEIKSRDLIIEEKDDEIDNLKDQNTTLQSAIEEYE